MKKIIVICLAFVSAFCFAACTKEHQGLTRQELQHKIDSLTNARIAELDDQARRDLDHRMKIEVKVKVDSIINARMQQKAAPVTPVPPARTVMAPKKPLIPTPAKQSGR